MCDSTVVIWDSTVVVSDLTVGFCDLVVVAIRLRYIEHDIYVVFFSSSLLWSTGHHFESGIVIGNNCGKK